MLNHDCGAFSSVCLRKKIMKDDSPTSRVRSVDDRAVFGPISGMGRIERRGIPLTYHTVYGEYFDFSCWFVFLSLNIAVS